MQKATVKKPKIIVIVGPTATGKSSLAVELAKEFHGEVISADSRQVYKGLDIGSAKITKAEMEGTPHHLLDVVNPDETFTAAQFKELAEKKVEEIVARGRLPIIVGGTGFYIQALIDDVTFPKIPPHDKLRELLEKRTAEELYTKLATLDPDRALSIDAHNKRRLIRAIEIATALGGVPKRERKNSPYNSLYIGIDLTDRKLKEKIHNRLVSRVEEGLIKEVQNLHKSGLSWERLFEFGLEYRSVAAFLQRKISKEEMLSKIETESWQYVKRQRTWFKQNNDIKAR